MSRFLAALTVLLCLFAAPTASPAALISYFAYPGLAIGEADYHDVQAGIFGLDANGERIYSSFDQQWVFTEAVDGIQRSTPQAIYGGGGTALGTTTHSAPDANTVIIKRTWSLTREADSLYGNNAASAGVVWFIPLVDMEYEVSGFFDNSGGTSSFQLRLRDETNYPSADSLSESVITAGPGHFTADGAWDDGYYRVGSLTGILTAGRIYSFSHVAFTRDETGGDSGAEAAGEVQLRLTAINAVPEPASLTLFGLGALGLMVRRRRVSRSMS